MERRKSERRTRKKTRSAPTSKTRTMAAMTTAASAAVGRFVVRPGAATSSTVMATAPTTPVSCVRDPADSATGVRDALLEMGNPRKKPAARFATPSPMSSRLGSTR